jgi:hypothetical protein
VSESDVEGEYARPRSDMPHRAILAPEHVLTASCVEICGQGPLRVMSHGRTGTVPGRKGRRLGESVCSLYTNNTVRPCTSSRRSIEAGQPPTGDGFACLNREISQKF